MIRNTTNSINLKNKKHNNGKKLTTMVRNTTNSFSTNLKSKKNPQQWSETLQTLFATNLKNTQKQWS